MNKDMEKQAKVTGKEILSWIGNSIPTIVSGAAAGAYGYQNEHRDKYDTVLDAVSDIGSMTGSDRQNAAQDVGLGTLIGGLTHFATHKGIKKVAPDAKGWIPTTIAAVGSGLLDLTALTPNESAVRHSIQNTPKFMEATINANEALHETAKAQEAAAKSQENAANKEADLLSQQLSNDKLKTILGIGAGALTLGGAGYALYKWLSDRSEERASRTRMKMHIDTPDGKGAIVDLPINNPQLSGKLADEFNRGVTRTVRRTARHNSVKRDPETGKLIPYTDYIEKYPEGVGMSGDEYTQKVANLVNMPADNLVDNFAQESNRQLPELSRSAMVRRFLDSFELNKAASTLSDRLTQTYNGTQNRTGVGIHTNQQPQNRIGTANNNTRVTQMMSRPSVNTNARTAYSTNTRSMQPARTPQPAPVTNTGAPQVASTRPAAQQPGSSSNIGSVAGAGWQQRSTQSPATQQNGSNTGRQGGWGIRIQDQPTPPPDLMPNANDGPAVAAAKQRIRERNQENYGADESGNVTAENVLRTVVNGPVAQQQDPFQKLDTKLQTRINKIDDTLNNATEKAIRQQNPNASDQQIQQLVAEAKQRDARFKEIRQKQLKNNIVMRQEEQIRTDSSLSPQQRQQKLQEFRDATSFSTMYEKQFGPGSYDKLPSRQRTDLYSAYYDLLEHGYTPEQAIKESQKHAEIYQKYRDKDPRDGDVWYGRYV